MSDLTISPVIISHASLTGLLNDDHTQYALLAGRSGGQILVGGTASGDDLTLRSTANSTKGTLFLDDLATLWPNVPDPAGGTMQVLNFTASRSFASGSNTVQMISLEPTLTYNASGSPGTSAHFHAAGTITRTASVGDLVYTVPGFRSSILHSSATNNVPPLLPDTFLDMSTSQMSGGFTSTTKWVPISFVDLKLVYAKDTSTSFTIDGGSGERGGVYTGLSGPAMKADAGATLTLYERVGWYSRDITWTANGTINLTNNVGFHVDDLIRGTNMIGYRSAVTSGTNKYSLYFTGTAQSVHVGKIRIGDTTSPTEYLEVAGNQVLTGNLYGGTATSDDLDIWANNNAFVAASTGRINVHDRVVWPDDWTHGTSAAFSQFLLNYSKTLTSNAGATSIIFGGFQFNGTLKYNVAQGLSIFECFNAGPTVQPTVAVTDTAGATVWAGFNSAIKYIPDNITGTFVTPDVIGYRATPSASKQANTTAATVTNLTSFGSWAPSNTLDAFGPIGPLGTGKITHLRHFWAKEPTFSGSPTVDEQVGVDIEAFTVGTALISLRSAGNAEMRHAGNAIFGSSTATAGATIDANGKFFVAGATGLITKYNNIATVSGGVPSELATVDLTGQSAAKAATTLYTPAATGMFRITVYLQITTAASTSSILGGATGVVITYNDGDGNVAQSDTVALQSAAGTIVTTVNTNTTATNLSGTKEIYARTGVAIQYAIGYTSVGLTAMQFAAHLKIEAM